MKKISLIGAGNIGGELAAIAASKSLGNIMLIDIEEGIARGKSLDLSQSGVVRNFSSKITGTSNLSKIKDSDVIIVTAGIARKPGMSRDDLIITNLKIMTSIGKAINTHSPKAFVICVTNPLDAMTWILKKISRIKKNMIVGMAGILDSSRFRFFLSEEIKVSSDNIQTMVLGGHGDTMVPMLNYTSVSGIPILEFIKEGKLTMSTLEKIIKRTRNGGGEIVGLLKSSSAYYAPAISAIEMAESFLLDQKKLLPCSVYLNGEYNIKDLFIGVPVIIGKKGVEDIRELVFSKKEQLEFYKSVKAVKKLTEKCKKLLE